MRRVTGLLVLRGCASKTSLPSRRPESGRKCWVPSLLGSALTLSSALKSESRLPRATKPVALPTT